MPFQPQPRDGLWMITVGQFCGGMTIEDGKVTKCAPFLKKTIRPTPHETFRAVREIYRGASIERIEKGV